MEKYYFQKSNLLLYVILLGDLKFQFLTSNLFYWVQNSTKTKIIRMTNNILVIRTSVPCAISTI